MATGRSRQHLATHSPYAEAGCGGGSPKAQTGPFRPYHSEDTGQPSKTQLNMDGAATLNLEYFLVELSTSIRFMTGAYAKVLENHADHSKLLLQDVPAKPNHSLALACDLAGDAGTNPTLLGPHSAHFSRALSSRRANPSQSRVLGQNYDLVIQRSLDALGRVSGRKSSLRGVYEYYV